MGGEPNGLHQTFSFGSNGYHSDDLGHGCVLMGTVEFQHFWNALDACFESPLGRKLIYAATDAEELIIAKPIASLTVVGLVVVGPRLLSSIGRSSWAGGGFSPMPYRTQPRRPLRGI